MSKWRTMADNKFRPSCHWLDIKMWSWHYVQLTLFSIFVILVIVTAIIKIKIGKRSVHQREVLLQISYASASWSVSYEKTKETPNSLKTFSLTNWQISHNDNKWSLALTFLKCQKFAGLNLLSAIVRTPMCWSRYQVCHNNLWKMYPT
jgi:hypothetical protein